MKRSQRKIVREGLEAFDECKVRVVRVTDYAYPTNVLLKVSGPFIHPVNRADRERKRSVSKFTEGSSKMYGGSGAKLDCPYTQDTGIEISSDYTNHNGVQRAHESLRQNAGCIACRGCQYSGVDPVEVSSMRRAYAAAETERIAQQKLLDAARAELDSVSPPHLLDDQY